MSEGRQRGGGREGGAGRGIKSGIVCSGNISCTSILHGGGSFGLIEYFQYLVGISPVQGFQGYAW